MKVCDMRVHTAVIDTGFIASHLSQYRIECHRTPIGYGYLDTGKAHRQTKSGLEVAGPSSLAALSGGYRDTG